MHSSFLLNNRFDTNGDQQLSAEELKPLLREDTKKNFTEMDLNGDHIISLKEFTEGEMGQSGGNDHDFCV